MQKERQVAGSVEIGEGRFKKGFLVFVGFFPPKGFNHPSSSCLFYRFLSCTSSAPAARSSEEESGRTGYYRRKKGSQKNP